MNAVRSCRRATRGACRLSLVLSLIVAVLAFPASLAAAQEDEEPTPAAQKKAEQPAPAKEKKAEKPAEGIEVSRMAICTSIEEREPVDAAEEFPRDVGALYCFSEIDQADPPVQIFHRWYIGDRLVDEIPITVRGSHWRCWSRKTIVPRWKGECRVEVATEAGDVLRVAEFTLE